MFYFGESESWAATYTLFQADGTVFDTLYIKHIGDRHSTPAFFEYVFEADGLKSESQYPLKLQGARSFQVSSEYNEEIMPLQFKENESFTLTIKQDGKTEQLTLRD